MLSNTVFTYLLFLGSFVAQALAFYNLQDAYVPSNFFDSFTFSTGQDPTHGYVNYVDRPTAQSLNLISITPQNQIYMGVDYTSVPGTEGRKSVRIQSNKVYTHGLSIVDIAHMPGQICGAWPAFWSYGPNWPANGEIDVLEGVNDQWKNQMSLHTSDTCVMSSASQQGTSGLTDCNGGGAGCGVSDWRSQSFGNDFNSNGGGVYATEWTSSYIKIYFWPRGSVPANVASSNPDPSTWGIPVANFQGNCNIDAHFANHQYVFDTTFCGDWAGATWASSTCCTNYVQNNPAAFKNAYWLINSLKIYKYSTTTATVSSSTTSTTSSRTTTSTTSTTSTSKSVTTFTTSTSSTSATTATSGSQTSTTTSASTTANSATATWSSAGCYTDAWTSRTLLQTAAIAANSMSIETCLAYCQAGGYSLAGVEYSQECYCDSSIHNGAVSAPAASCNMACKGNAVEICGGADHMNLYSWVPTSTSSTSSTSTSNTRSTSTTSGTSTSTSTTTSNTSTSNTSTSSTSTSSTSASTTSTSTTSSSSTSTSSTATPSSTPAAKPFPVPASYGTGCYYPSGDVVNFANTYTYASALNQCIQTCNSKSCSVFYLGLVSATGGFTCITDTSPYVSTNLNCNNPATYGEYLIFSVA